MISFMTSVLKNLYKAFLSSNESIVEQDALLRNVNVFVIFVLIANLVVSVIADLILGLDIYSEYVLYGLIFLIIFIVHSLYKKSNKSVRISVITAYSVISPYLSERFSDNHLSNSLILPVIIALLLDGWLWLILAPTIAISIVAAEHRHVLEGTTLQEWLLILSIISILIFSRTITDSAIRSVKNRTKLLQESESQFLNTIESLQSGIVIYTLDYRCIYWNSFMSALMRYPAYKKGDSTEALEVIKMLAGEEASRQLKISIDKVAKGESFSLDDTMFGMKNTGRTMWISRKFVPQKDSKGQIVGAIESVEDVTLRRILQDDLAAKNREVLDAYERTLEGWTAALDLRDNETRGHSSRVVLYTVRLARAMGIQESEIVHIRRGALLHDIGKLSIPDEILKKQDKLTPEEWVVMRTHPEKALDFLKGIEFLRPALSIPLYHHERWNGSGYPYGLSGENIPLPARLFSVVDVFDALRSDRSYRSAWSVEETLKYLKEQSGVFFCPRSVNTFTTIKPWEEII